MLQEEYRGQGFAKAVTLKLLRDRAVDLVPDGLYHADVDVGNLQSQGVCRSLNGTTEWSGYCTLLYHVTVILTKKKLTDF